jgi:chaperonin GroES
MRKARPAGASSSPIPPRRSPRRARVVAVGPGKTLENGTVSEPGVKRGDRILFSKYAGTEISVEGVEHIIIREDDVLAIYE